MTDRSQTSTGLSECVHGGLHKVLTLPATVLLAKPIQQTNNKQPRTLHAYEASKTILKVS